MYSYMKWKQGGEWGGVGWERKVKEGGKKMGI
jgi:hypothetical protein